MYRPEQAVPVYVIDYGHANSAGDAMPAGKKRLAYVDPALNVVVVIENTMRS